MMKIKNNISLKYILGIHLENDLLDDDSFLFEIISYLIKSLESKNKKIDLSNLKFSSSFLKNIFGNRLKDETFKNKLVSSLKKLLANEFLIKKENEDLFIITKKSIIKFYTIYD